jgi:hypothetical protein
LWISGSKNICPCLSLVMMKNSSDFVILNSGYIGGYKLHVLDVRWMFSLLPFNLRPLIIIELLYIWMRDTWIFFIWRFAFKSLMSVIYCVCEFNFIYTLLNCIIIICMLHTNHKSSHQESHTLNNICQYSVVLLVGFAFYIWILLWWLDFV